MLTSRAPSADNPDMEVPTERLRILAPAKINLHLRAGPRRADGYHSLLSWMCTVGVFDTLNFQQAHSPGVVLSTNLPTLPVDQSYLVVRVAEALSQALAGNPAASASGVQITLHKQIPIGAGLGGGSSDGASTLLALNRLWQANWPKEKLAHFAAQFGSDLPFFFFGPSSLCGGRGEVVRPIASPVAGWAVLI